MEAIEIIEFTENLKDYFKKLNFEWLEKFFVVLPLDEYVLTNPIESIIDKGGYIDDKTYEIAKMAVTEKYQHQGIGKNLMDFAIQKAKGLNAELVILYSNTDLKIAVNMYAKYGFQVIPKTDFHNERANIKMEMKLK